MYCICGFRFIFLGFLKFYLYYLFNNLIVYLYQLHIERDFRYFNILVRSAYCFSHIVAVKYKYSVIVIILIYNLVLYIQRNSMYSTLEYRKYLI